ncbi:MAG TPA: sulfotransferase [Acetobacteraceae bacterium]|nr:sulfotransferase [Acetobacteraceae bacterium]
MDLFRLLGYRRWWYLHALSGRHRSDMDGIVAIGGAARSGTTLLRSMLGRHPMIAGAPELTVFLSRISAPADIAGRLDWEPATVEAWQRTSRSQVEFIERVRDAVLAEAGKPIWAEKTPANVRRFGFIRRAFPRAKLVHIIRDGRDTVCSLRRKDFAKLRGAAWDSTQAALRCGELWAHDVRAGKRHRGDPAYYELRYEDLVRAPEETLRPLLAFIGVEWDDSVLSGDAGQCPVSRGTNFLIADEAVAAGGLFASSVGRWRSELTEAQLAALRPVMAPLLRSLGYETEEAVPAGELSRGNESALSASSAG